MNDPRYSDRVKFSVVRNPWDWYVSWFSYSYDDSSSEGPAPPAGWVFEKKNIEKGNIAFFDKGKFIRWMHEVFHGSLVQENRHYQKMKQLDIGWCTYNHVRYCLNVDVNLIEETPQQFYEMYEQRYIMDKTLKFENLQKDFKELMRHTPYENDSLPHEKTSQRQKDYRSYYDQKTKDMVTSMDKLIIEKYGYEF